MPNISGWDHVVRSNVDLPAPAGGLITLTSGSWAFSAPIALGDNVLYVPAGTDVYLQGLGTDKLITGNTACLQVEGTAAVKDMALHANGGIGLEIAGAGSVRSQNCIITGDSAFTSVVLSSTAQLRDIGSHFYNINGGAGIDIGDTAKVYLIESGITSNATAVKLTGGKLWAAESNFITDSLGPECIHLNNANSQLFLDECDVYSGVAASPAIRINAGSTMRIIGGTLHTLSTSRSPGIYIDGAIPIMRIHGGNNSQLSHGIQWASGAVISAVMSDTYNSSSVLVGITWAAANLPSMGVSLFGNHWNVAAPLSGFTAASARCVLRGCCNNAGLMTETAIV